MGFWRTLFHYLTLGIVDSNEEHERKNTVCAFDNELTFEDFERIAIEVAKPIKRLYVTVTDHYVCGEVKTVSGINIWHFELDFNDFGKVTGNYWYARCDNRDSDIPSTYAQQLRAALMEFRGNVNDSNASEEADEIFCPNCNAILSSQPGFRPDFNAYTCKACGQHLFNPTIYDGDKFKGVYWYCDNCNALLNKQRGFNDSCGFWHCSECGFKNEISEDNISD